VQRNLGAVEHHQQFGLVGGQPREQAIEGGEAGVPPEDAMEGLAHVTAATRRRIVCFGVENWL
jgi:hypothetical protein